MRLGVSGDRLDPCKLDNADIIPNDIPSENAVAGEGNPEKSDGEPPAVVLSNLMPYYNKSNFSVMEQNFCILTGDTF